MPVAAAAVHAVPQVVKEGEETEEKEQTIWELLDEMLPGNGTTLATGMAVCLAVLFGICVFMLQKATGTDVYIFGGFIALMFCLLITVVWVLYEARSMEAAKDAAKAEEKKKE